MSNKLFPNGIAYYKLPKIIVRKLPAEPALMLIHLIDLEELLKPGFYQTYSQLRQALPWGRRKIEGAIKYLVEHELVFVETKKKDNKMHFTIVEERVLDLLDGEVSFVQNVRSRSYKMSERRQDLIKTTNEHDTSITCTREDVSQTLKSGFANPELNDLFID